MSFIKKRGVVAVVFGFLFCFLVGFSVFAMHNQPYKGSYLKSNVVAPVGYNLQVLGSGKTKNNLMCSFYFDDVFNNFITKRFDKTLAIKYCNSSKLKTAKIEFDSYNKKYLVKIHVDYNPKEDIDDFNKRISDLFLSAILIDGEGRNLGFNFNKVFFLKTWYECYYEIFKSFRNAKNAKNKKEVTIENENELEHIKNVQEEKPEFKGVFSNKYSVSCKLSDKYDFKEGRDVFSCLFYFDSRFVSDIKKFGIKDLKIIFDSGAVRPIDLLGVYSNGYSHSEKCWVGFDFDLCPRESLDDLKNRIRSLFKNIELINDEKLVSIDCVVNFDENFDKYYKRLLDLLENNKNLVAITDVKFDLVENSGKKSKILSCSCSVVGSVLSGKGVTFELPFKGLPYLKKSKFETGEMFNLDNCIHVAEDISTEVGGAFNTEIERLYKYRPFADVNNHIIKFDIDYDPGESVCSLQKKLENIWNNLKVFDRDGKKIDAKFRIAISSNACEEFDTIVRVLENGQFDGEKIDVVGFECDKSDIDSGVETLNCSFYFDRKFTNFFDDYVRIIGDEGYKPLTLQYEINREKKEAIVEKEDFCGRKYSFKLKVPMVPGETIDAFNDRIKRILNGAKLIDVKGKEIKTEGFNFSTSSLWNNTYTQLVELNENFGSINVDEPPKEIEKVKVRTYVTRANFNHDEKVTGFHYYFEFDENFSKECLKILKKTGTTDLKVILPMNVLGAGLEPVEVVAKNDSTFGFRYGFYVDFPVFGKLKEDKDSSDFSNKLGDLVKGFKFLDGKGDEICVKKKNIEILGDSLKFLIENYKCNKYKD